MRGASVLRSLKPMIVKEFRQIRRDPTSLGMLLGLPALLIMLVGYALNFDVRHIPLVILDESRTADSRMLAEKFRHTEYFDDLGTVSSYSEIERLFMSGKAKAALVFPTTFGDDILSGRDTRVQILLDGSDANSAGQAVMYAVGIITDFSRSLQTEVLERTGSRSYLPIDFRPRIWYNPDLRSSAFLIPGLIGFIIVLTAVISTSMTVVREKERGTMEQLMVSPLKPVHIILGKTIPYLAISLIAATLILILGYFLFGVEVRGSLVVLYGAIVLIVLGALGQGLLISTVTDSQQFAFMISVFSSLLPSFLLSGFVFPVSSMPVALQVISNIAVNKFFLVVVRGVMIKGVGFSAVQEQFLYMAIFTAVMLGVSIKRMQKRTL
jgi:ABC-2 type transport system permease protein